MAGNRLVVAAALLHAAHGGADSLVSPHTTLLSNPSSAKTYLCGGCTSESFVVESCLLCYSTPNVECETCTPFQSPWERAIEKPLVPAPAPLFRTPERPRSCAASTGLVIAATAAVPARCSVRTRQRGERMVVPSSNQGDSPASPPGGETSLVRSSAPAADYDFVGGCCRDADGTAGTFVEVVLFPAASGLVSFAPRPHYFNAKAGIPQASNYELCRCVALRCVAPCYAATVANLRAGASGCGSGRTCGCGAYVFVGVDVSLVSWLWHCRRLCSPPPFLIACVSRPPCRTAHCIATWMKTAQRTSWSQSVGKASQSFTVVSCTRSPLRPRPTDSTVAEAKNHASERRPARHQWCPVPS